MFEKYDPTEEAWYEDLDKDINRGGYMERIRTNKYVITDENRYSVFSRADALSITEDVAKDYLKKDDELFSKFAEVNSLLEYENDAIHYHYDVPNKMAKLNMAYTKLGRDGFSLDPHLILDYQEFGTPQRPLLILRLNNHLGSREPKENTYTIYGYDESKGVFTYPREEESEKNNGEIYKELCAYLRGDENSKDIFLEIASVIYPDIINLTR